MKLESWERRTELTLGAAALLFLGAYAWPILKPDLDAEVTNWCGVVTWIIWLMFACDYLVRLCLAPQRITFMRQHVVDLLVIALPLLRPLRLLRVVALLRIVNRGATLGLRGRVSVYVCGAVSLVVFVGSLAELDAERRRDGANIETFGDALWWSASTITTVGYGDRFPVTTTGRFVAVGLMLCGIALVGIVTASLATWLLERVRAEEQDTQADLAILTAEVRQLRTLLTPGLVDATARQDSQPSPSSSESSR